MTVVYGISISVKTPYNVKEKYSEKEPYDVQESYKEQEPYMTTECSSVQVPYTEQDCKTVSNPYEVTLPGNVVLFDKSTTSVQAGSYQVYLRYVDVSGKTQNYISGSFTETAGFDISFYVMDQQNYNSFKNGQSYTTYVVENRRESANFNFIPPKTDYYYFVFDNRYSSFTNKLPQISATWGYHYKQTQYQNSQDCVAVTRYRAETQCKEVQKIRTVDKQRTVTKYRDVEKERVITKYETLYDSWTGVHEAEKV